MRVMIASDHVGYQLKAAIRQFLRRRGIQVADGGTASAEEVVDYPDYADAVAIGVSSGAFDRGILICGSGLGMCMAANRWPGVRAAVCQDEHSARLARAHNDSNVLCLGAWVVTPQQAEAVLATWLSTPYEAGRHVPRVDKLNRSPQAGSTPAAESSVPLELPLGVALSPTVSPGGPLLYMGRLSDGLAAAAGIGLDQVELSVRDPAILDRTALADQLRGCGLTLSALATGQSCLHDSLCLGDPNPDIRDAAIDRLCAVIDLAEPFGAAVILGGVRGRPAATSAQARDQHAHVVEAARTCARYAGDRGVRLLLEPINRYETSCIHTAAEAITAIGEIDQPNVGLLLDTFHMHIEERDPRESIRMCRDHLAYVHFADSNRRAPGQGQIDFPALLRTLAEIGYRGPLVGEFLPLPDDDTAMRLFGDFLGSMGPASAMESTAETRMPS